jgi:uncharacterized protein (DUF58 family)
MNNTTYAENLRSGTIAGSRYALAIPSDAMRGNSGYQLSNRAGSSLDFKDFREYQPGDDLRRIDWGAFARSDKLIIKLYREEVAPHLDLLIDASASMAPPSLPAKTAALMRLAAIITTAATNAKCSHKTHAAGKSISPVINGSRSPTEWHGINFDSNTPPTTAIHTPPVPRWRRHGIRILVSDLLWQDDPMNFLRSFARNAAAVHIIQILCRSEIEPDIHGNFRLNDIETGGSEDIFVDSTTRARYRNALARHRQAWSLACRRIGATFSTLTAEDVIREQPLLTPLETTRVLEAI